MKFAHFLLLLLVVLSKSTTPVEFGSQLESDFPVALSSLYRWSLMESAIDSLDAIFQGKRPPPSGNVDDRIIGFYVLSTNPQMSDAEFEHHMFRIFRKSNVLTSAWKTATLDALTVPQWFYVELRIRQEIGDTVSQALKHMVKFVREKSKHFDDPQFSSEETVRHIATLWWLFGLPTLDQSGSGLYQYTAEPIPGSTFYTMRPETKKSALQHLSLSSMKPSTPKYT